MPCIYIPDDLVLCDGFLPIVHSSCGNTHHDACHVCDFFVCANCRLAHLDVTNAIIYIYII